MSLREIERTLALLFFLLVIVSLITPSVSAAVTDGNFDYVASSDFAPTLSQPYPYGYEYYLLAGEQGQVSVGFTSSSGTGDVVVYAFSDAFTNNTMTTENVSETYGTYIFNLTFNIKTDIDGMFRVVFEARNEFDAFIVRTTVRITVWSPKHLSAAEELFSVERKLYTAGYKSPQGIENVTLAQDDYVSATLAYGRRDWDDTIVSCASALSYIEKAYTAEIAWLQSIEENRLESTQVNDAMGNLLNAIVAPTTLLVYLFVIVTILAIGFLIPAIWRKIKPVKTTTTS